MHDKPSVLLIEANNMIRDLIQLAIEWRGIPVMPAKDGSEALDLILRHSPSVVILDIFLPHEDGFELMRNLKNHSPFDTVFIVLSSLGFKEVVQKATRSGASDFIIKPFDVEILIHKVQQALRGDNNPGSIRVESDRPQKAPKQVLPWFPSIRLSKSELQSP